MTAKAAEPEKSGGPERFFLQWPVWAARFLKLSSRLVRVKVTGYPDLSQTGPVIFAHWHSEDLSLLPHFGHSRARILVSPSRDGGILSLAVAELGFDSCRGSSSRGGLGGLLELKKSLKAGQSVILAVDGPRGPRQVAKPGAVYLAAKTGRPIYPIGSACSRALIFKGSWNQTRLPLPGARLAVVFGPPLELPPEAAAWPALWQSRWLTAAICDNLRRAELWLEAWSEGREAEPGGWDEK